MVGIRESITLDETIEFLNELIGIDRPAVAALLLNRVPCNERLARHPTVQVMRRNGFQVGMLGILNGLFGADESGRGTITIMLDDAGEIAEIQRRPPDDWRGEEEEEDGEG